MWYIFSAWCFCRFMHPPKAPATETCWCRVETESDRTRWRMGGEVKGKEANGVGSQQFSAWLGTVHPVLLQSFSADPHSKKASTRLNWHPRGYKWTRPFRWKTESGFCACAITFRFYSTAIWYRVVWLVCRAVAADNAQGSREESDSKNFSSSQIFGPNPSEKETLGICLT